MIKLIWVVGYNAWLLGSLWLTGAAALTFIREMDASYNLILVSEGKVERRRVFGRLLYSIGFAIAWPLALLYRFTRTQLTNQVKDM